MESSSSQDDPITSINVTPLVDICLVLVIIFMVIAPFAMQAGIKAAQSKAGAAKGKAAIDKNVTLELSKDAVKINGLQVEASVLEANLRQAIEKSADRLVMLSAQRDVYVGRVVEILDLSKQMGAKKLAIMNQ